MLNFIFNNVAKDKILILYLVIQMANEYWQIYSEMSLGLSQENGLKTIDDLAFSIISKSLIRKEREKTAGNRVHYTG